MPRMEIKRNIEQRRVSKRGNEIGYQDEWEAEVRFDCDCRSQISLIAKHEIIESDVNGRSADGC